MNETSKNKWSANKFTNYYESLFIELIDDRNMWRGNEDYERREFDDRKRRDISINLIIWHANNHKFIDPSYETRLRENILLDQIVGGI